METVCEIKWEDTEEITRILENAIAMNRLHQEADCIRFEVRESEEKFRSMVSIFVAYAREQGGELSCTFSDGQGHITLGIDKRIQEQGSAADSAMPAILAAKVKSFWTLMEFMEPAYARELHSPGVKS